MRIMWQIIQHTIHQVRMDRTFRVLVWSFFVGLLIIVLLSFLVLEQQGYVFITFVTSLAELLVLLQILFSVAKRYATHKDKNLFVFYHMHWIPSSQVYTGTTRGYIFVTSWMYVIIVTITSIVAMILGIFVIPLVVALFASMVKMVIVLITTMMLSVIARPLLTVISTVVIYILAHGTWFIHHLAQNAESSILSLVYKWLYILLPPLDYLSYADQYLQNTMLSF